MSDQDPGQRAGGFAWRPVVAGAAAFIAVIPIVVALLLSPGGRDSAAAATGVTSTSPFKPAPAPSSAQTGRRLPPGTGAVVAVVQHRTRMRSAPGGHPYASVPTRTQFGSPEAMWVVRLSGRWLGVVSPIAGNGRIGWIPARDASLSRVNWQLRVALSKRRLTVLENGEVRAHYAIAIGSPAAPTPTGRFAVTDRLQTGNAGGPYGCCILALSAKAPHAISDWNGGNRIAIHSTTETWSIGKPVSHGCMRLTLGEGRWLLGHIPLGTPTLVGA